MSSQNKLDKTDRAIRGISLKAPMTSYLIKNTNIIFDNEHRAYDLIHCETRSDDNPKACKHGLMDLHVETWQEDPFQIVAVSFNYIQNGDIMRDPEIVYRFLKKNPNENPSLSELPLTEIPIEYTLSSLGVYQRTYQTIDDKEYVNLKLIKELQQQLKRNVKHCKEFNYYMRSKN